METETRNKLFHRGMVLFKQGRLNEAGEVFRHLVERGSTDPLHLSYHGLLMATVRGKPREGRKICERAVSLGAYEAQIFLNLVRVHEALGERHKAVEVLRAGIRRNRGDRRLLKAIERLSPRKPPLRSLHRDHPLNKHLGILISRCSKGASVRRVKKTDKKTKSKRKPAAALPRRLRALKQT
jgi:tetratricopeptide (TPR) repeat protein